MTCLLNARLFFSTNHVDKVTLVIFRELLYVYHKEEPLIAAE